MEIQSPVVVWLLEIWTSLINCTFLNFSTLQTSIINRSNTFSFKTSRSALPFSRTTPLFIMDVDLNDIDDKLKQIKPNELDYLQQATMDAKSAEGTIHLSTTTE